MNFFLYSRWFRHITEASNAYKQRGYRQGGGDPPAGRPQNGLDDHHHHNRGKHDTDQSLGVPGAGLGDLLGDKKGQPTGRSHSFHEQSTSSREPHPERQPSSPPEDRAQSEADTFEKKTGKFYTDWVTLKSSLQLSWGESRRHIAYFA